MSTSPQPTTLTLNAVSPAPSLPISKTAPLQLYTSLAVFLLGAIALIVSSGYSVGAALLLLASPWLLVIRPSLGLTRQDWMVIGILIAYSSAGMLAALFDGQIPRGLDKPARFLLAVPPLLLIMAYPPRLAWMWSGLACGAIAAGTWATWQKLVEGAARAGGLTHIIQFGNLSLLMGVLCLAGLGWAWAQRSRRRRWLLLLGFGALCGILGSMFSGSRGGWVGFPLMLFVLYRGYGRQLPKQIKLVVILVLTVVVSLIYVIPQSGVQARAHEALSDIKRYLSDESRTTSVGARFEMWIGATHLIKESPLLGHGENGYQAGMQRLADKGIIHPGVTIYDHAHNDFIDAFVKRGAVGLLLLLALYLVPIRLFTPWLNDANIELRSIAIAGVLLPVAYIDFGFSQVFMKHNSGVTMYAFWLAVFYGVFKSLKSDNKIQPL